MKSISCAFVLFLTVIALARAKSFIRFANVNTEEANRYVSALAASLRTDPSMPNFDPLILPAEQRFGILGFYRLDNATATGLSTIDRHGDCQLVFQEKDQTGRLNATLRTNDIRVSAHLKASTKEAANEGQIYGSIKKLYFSISIIVRQNFTAELDKFEQISPIYIEKIPGYSEPIKEELTTLVEEAIDETFAMKFGPYIQKMVNHKLNIASKIKSFVSNNKFPLVY